MDKVYHVYILTNRQRTVLYIGVTGNLNKRIREHKNKKTEGFTSRYNVDILIYCEAFNSPEYAIAREKQLKGWKRSKKEELIKRRNPEMKELPLWG